MRAIVRAEAAAARRRQQASARAAREVARQTAADAKQEARSYLAARLAEAEDLTAEVRQREAEIDRVLVGSNAILRRRDRAVDSASKEAAAS